MPISEFMDPNAFVMEGMSRLVILVREVMGRVKQTAQGLAPTKRITWAIEQTEPIVSETTISDSVVVDLAKAPEAAAFELGSGVHGLFEHTYPIVPKAGKSLVFDWPNERLPSQHAHTPDGKVILPIVNHPGVEARPYLQPAMETEVNEKFRDDVDQIMQNVFGVENVNIDIRMTL